MSTLARTRHVVRSSNPRVAGCHRCFFRIAGTGLPDQVSSERRMRVVRSLASSLPLLPLSCTFFLSLSSLCPSCLFSFLSCQLGQVYRWGLLKGPNSGLSYLIFATRWGWCLPASSRRPWKPLLRVSVFGVVSARLRLVSAIL